MNLLRFYAFVIKIALILALIGQLKACTLELLGLAAQKSSQGIISYGTYSRLLTGKP